MCDLRRSAYAPIFVAICGKPHGRSVLGLPRPPHSAHFAVVGLAGVCWFVLIYGGTDFVTSRRTLRVPIQFKAEQQIPFVPLAVWVYMTMYALFLMAPFVLRSPRTGERPRKSGRCPERLIARPGRSISSVR